MAKVTIRKWGNSLAVRIPQKIAEQAKITEGTQVEMYVTSANEVMVRRAYPDANDQRALRKHLLALRAKSKEMGIKSHHEMFAEPVGEELI